jgi:hypothetical protein
MNSSAIETKEGMIEQAQKSANKYQKPMVVYRDNSEYGGYGVTQLKWWEDPTILGEPSDYWKSPGTTYIGTYHPQHSQQ